MNELMVSIFSNKPSWVYYPTEQTNVNAAFGELITKLNSLGINCDNLCVFDYALRDADGNDI